MTTTKKETSSKVKKGVTPAVKSKYSIETVKEFAADVKQEFGKIAWPNKKHTLGSTVVVVILVSIISAYLGLVDLLLGNLIGKILN
ncbi:MAG: preprotein translocase subunit SecE [Proteobacteria bacterium]|nr:preprotein translocase subunit SecE [Pseudomonadota bacterium]MBU1714027.1 preprotein translocase subunit SecE [Pseudomonadota bacterium]